jgi:hypothetical protein
MGLFAEFSSNCLGAMMQTGSAVLVVKRDRDDHIRGAAQDWGDPVATNNLHAWGLGCVPALV